MRAASGSGEGTVEPPPAGGGSTGGGGSTAALGDAIVSEPKADTTPPPAFTTPPQGTKARRRGASVHSVGACPRRRCPRVLGCLPASQQRRWPCCPPAATNTSAAAAGPHSRPAGDLPERGQAAIRPGLPRRCQPDVRVPHRVLLCARRQHACLPGAPHGTLRACRRHRWTQAAWLVAGQLRPTLPIIHPSWALLAPRPLLPHPATPQDASGSSTGSGDATGDSTSQDLVRRRGPLLGPARCPGVPSSSNPRSCPRRHSRRAPPPTSALQGSLFKPASDGTSDTTSQTSESTSDTFRPSSTFESFFGQAEPQVRAPSGLQRKAPAGCASACRPAQTHGAPTRLPPNCAEPAPTGVARAEPGAAYSAAFGGARPAGRVAGGRRLCEVAVARGLAGSRLLLHLFHLRARALPLPHRRRLPRGAHNLTVPRGCCRRLAIAYHSTAGISSTCIVPGERPNIRAATADRLPCTTALHAPPIRT